MKLQKKFHSYNQAQNNKIYLGTLFKSIKYGCLIPVNLYVNTEVN